MDILKHYGFVVGAQNQIINLNGFILGPNDSTSSDNGQSPTAPSPNIYQNQNHSALTQTVAAHLIHNTSASSTGIANDNGDFRNGESISITRPDQILAISPTSQQSQSLNISNFNTNSNSIHSLDVEVSSSSCSSNRCNSSLSSANNADNTRYSQNSCFIDNTSHQNRNARASNPHYSRGGRRVSDV